MALKPGLLLKLPDLSLAMPPSCPMLHKGHKPDNKLLNNYCTLIRPPSELASTPPPHQPGSKSPRSRITYHILLLQKMSPCIASSCALVAAHLKFFYKAFWKKACLHLAGSDNNRLISRASHKLSKLDTYAADGGWYFQDILPDLQTKKTTWDLNVQYRQLILNIQYVPIKQLQK